MQSLTNSETELQTAIKKYHHSSHLVTTVWSHATIILNQVYYKSFLNVLPSSNLKTVFLLQQKVDIIILFFFSHSKKNLKSYNHLKILLNIHPSTSTTSSLTIVFLPQTQLVLFTLCCYSDKLVIFQPLVPTHLLFYVHMLLSYSFNPSGLCLTTALQRGPHWPATFLYNPSVSLYLDLLSFLALTHYILHLCLFSIFPREWNERGQISPIFSRYPVQRTFPEFQIFNKCMPGRESEQKMQIVQAKTSSGYFQCVSFSHYVQSFTTYKHIYGHEHIQTLSNDAENIYF